MPHSKSCFCILAAAALLAGAPMPASADTVVVTADRMVDVVAGRVTQHPKITIVDGRIASVGTQDGTVPAGARRIDLPGMTLLPGLIDMHTHLTSDPHYCGYRSLEFTDNFWTVVGVANAKKTLEAGFTTIRNVGSDNFDDVAIKQGIEQGFIRTAHRSGDLRHRRDRRPLRLHRVPAVNHRRRARRSRTGPTSCAPWCASCASTAPKSSSSAAPAASSPRPTRVGAQQYDFDGNEGDRRRSAHAGPKVAVHAHGTSGIKDAIRAGVDTIEHASLADDEAFALAKQHGT